MHCGLVWVLVGSDFNGSFSGFPLLPCQILVHLSCWRAPTVGSPSLPNPTCTVTSGARIQNSTITFWRPLPPSPSPRRWTHPWSWTPFYSAQMDRLRPRWSQSQTPANREVNPTNQTAWGAPRAGTGSATLIGQKTHHHRCHPPMKKATFVLSAGEPLRGRTTWSATRRLSTLQTNSTCADRATSHRRTWERTWGSPRTRGGTGRARRRRWRRKRRRRRRRQQGGLLWRSTPAHNALLPLWLSRVCRNTSSWITHRVKGQMRFQPL